MLARARAHALGMAIRLCGNQGCTLFLSSSGSHRRRTSDTAIEIQTIGETTTRETETRGTANGSDIYSVHDVVHHRQSVTQSRRKEVVGTLDQGSWLAL